MYLRLRHDATLFTLQPDQARRRADVGLRHGDGRGRRAAARHHAAQALLLREHRPPLQEVLSLNEVPLGSTSPPLTPPLLTQLPSLPSSVTL